MKKVIIMFVLAMGIATANAQENVTVGTDNGSEQPTLTKEVYPQKEADGDPVSRADKEADLRPHGSPARLGSDLRQDRPRHFPSEVRYVDLGSPDLIAGKADGAENVIRVKGYREELPERNQYVRDNGGREFLYLQREVRLRTAAAQRGDVRLHP